MLTLAACGPDEFFAEPNLPALIAEYEAECSIEGLPKANAKMEVYKLCGDALHAFVARIEGVMIGFIAIVTPIIPHYGAYISTTESFFVAKEYRSSGAGIKLLALAERYAISRGSPGLLISTPKGGALAAALDGRKDYTETNRVFFKRLA